ncbi:MAG: class I SAM-dependent methyltransferase [Kiritimatiellia bacterium]|nr:class I SAM-dependent methyltransferase [Kiritimatiellia bacterium]
MPKLHLIPNSEEYHAFWFEDGKSSNIRFWSRFDAKPDFRGQVVLDVGCGQGSLCLDMARGGARKVVGTDIDGPVIEFARRNLQARYPEWQSVVSFKCCKLDALPDNTFDLIVSKDTFEHVLDLRGLLGNIRRCLKPGGCLYAGFGPLYKSLNGHHWRAHFGLPWGHLLIPRSWHLALVNRGRKKKIRSLHEVDSLNELFFADYEKIFMESGLDMILLRINQSEHIISKIMTLLRNIPFLKEYCTHNIYCIMEKPRNCSDSLSKNIFHHGLH